MTLENYQMFNIDLYDDNKVTKEARITWHPMNSILRQESINQIYIGEVNM